MRCVGRRVRDTDGAWRHMERVLVRQKLQAARGSACDVFSPFLVGFCLGLAVLSLYAFYLAVG